MNDPRIRPAQLLKVGEFFAANGDRSSALEAYREVAQCDEILCAAEALRRIDTLDKASLAASAGR